MVSTAKLGKNHQIITINDIKKIKRGILVIYFTTAYNTEER